MDEIEPMDEYVPTVLPPAYSEYYEERDLKLFVSYRFEPGAVLDTYLGNSVTIDSYIRGGGQYDVYKVTYNGQKKALKWYRPDTVKDTKAFYDNLTNNVKTDPPDKSFIWPMDVVEMRDWPHGWTFGYIIDLIPDGYYELTDLLWSSGEVEFTSFKAIVESAIRIASAFQNLNKIGYTFQTLNSGSFFINPQTGDVRICDFDNVAPNGIDMGIIGTPQYMAPEMVMGEAKPNAHTDEFSLAIVLFMLLCGGHPLEGERWICPCLTPELEKKLYGSGAVFIFDPNDESNRPVKGVHVVVINRWGVLPQYVREIFIEAFSQEAIKNPGKRVKYINWLKVLTRFQSDIIRCPECQNEIFITDASNTECDKCHKLYEVKHTLKLQDYSVTAAKNTRIYRCQLGTCNADAALNPVALVVTSKNDPSVLGLRNMTGSTIVGTTPGGKTNQVKPGEVIPLKTGISVSVFDSKIDIQ